MYVCMYINNIFIVYDNGWDWVVYLKFVENVIGRAKRAPHWGVQSRFRVIYIMLSVCRMSVVCQINCVGGNTCGQRACSKSFFGG